MKTYYESLSDQGLANALRSVLYSNKPEYSLPIIAEALARLLETKTPVAHFVPMGPTSK